MTSFTIDKTFGALTRRDRGVVTLMTFEAATLAVFAALHLSGTLRFGSNRSYGAGFAEALICVALAAGAWAFVRSPRGRGRGAARFSVAFAIFGFIVGLTFTVDSGDAIEVAYHLTMLPVLVATAALLARRRAAPPRTA